ncbi:hypothetical protein H696_04091 [Fonticula alba]|uniref:DUF7803 domain-containing protein n=1 Tax=Fonticula alba TaxID=691883 RepID=A0A058Z6X1_FONAL|nr:hypothetical protein H696_04091 [Fonticula alba]KCV69683.1 hypothetical protein H696_04091 [Fonticula alba]|eukprot:XP_009496248.1 hypothetical protein H696_04091 [Fonticula alba]
MVFTSDRRRYTETALMDVPLPAMPPGMPSSEIPETVNLCAMSLRNMLSCLNKEQTEMECTHHIKAYLSCSETRNRELFEVGDRYVAKVHAQAVAADEHLAAEQMAGQGLLSRLTFGWLQSGPTREELLQRPENAPHREALLAAQTLREGIISNVQDLHSRLEMADTVPPFEDTEDGPIEYDRRFFQRQLNSELEQCLRWIRVLGL